MRLFPGPTPQNTSMFAHSSWGTRPACCHAGRSRGVSSTRHRSLTGLARHCPEPAWLRPLRGSCGFVSANGGPFRSVRSTSFVRPEAEATAEPFRSVCSRAPRSSSCWCRPRPPPRPRRGLVCSEAESPARWLRRRKRASLYAGFNFKRQQTNNKQQRQLQRQLFGGAAGLVTPPPPALDSL